jgi:hypothetical protein
MIKFFTKIRSQLIGEGRMRKYFFYAIGEILLVMVGILLALQFNAWENERGNDKKERWYLSNIQEDIYYQQEYLKSIKEHYIECIKIGKSILTKYNQKNSFSNLDSLNHKLNALMITESFPNVNNTYRELVSSGQFALIEDKDLSMDIINYYLFTDENEADMKNNIEQVFYKGIYPVFNNLAQVSLEEEYLNEDEKHLLNKDENLSLFILKKLNDPENKLSLLNAIKTRILIQDSHLALVEETLETGSDLIKKIDSELDK